MSTPPTLAACLMVRNESDHLRCCLASLAGRVDAIYVTDTGSTDDTVAVARSFGAVVREFPWCDDFSAARNASIVGVTEDWILTLDADDEFPAGELAKVRGLLAPDACAATLRYVVAPTHSPVRKTKLLRNGLGAHFEGIIHEHVTHWLRAKALEGWRQQDLPVTLEHRGYTAEARPAKLARNLPLLRREWARLQAEGDRAARLYIGAELGLALAHAGHQAGGAQLLEQLLAEITSGERMPVAVVLKVLSHLLWVLGELGRTAAALAAVRLMEAPLAGCPAYQLHRGLTELAAGEHEAALVWLERFRYTGTMDDLDLPLPVGYPGASLWDALARCHLGRRDYPAAADCYLRCLELRPDDREVQLRLLVAQRMTNP